MSDKITSYLQLFGIQGECTDPRFLTYIPILNWFFDGGKDSNTWGGAAKTSLREVVFMSYLENSSYKLQEYCANGRHIKSGKLVVLNGQSVFFRATFEDLLVEDCQTNGGARLIFLFTVTFHEMETAYDAKAVNTRMKQAGWTVITNPAQ